MRQVRVTGQVAGVSLSGVRVTRQTTTTTKMDGGGGREVVRGGSRHPSCLWGFICVKVYIFFLSCNIRLDM